MNLVQGIGRHDFRCGVSFFKTKIDIHTHGGSWLFLWHIIVVLGTGAGPASVKHCFLPREHCSESTWLHETC